MCKEDFDRGFSADLFNRKKYAENLTEILHNLDKSVTLSINSEWGTVKTTFVNSWIDSLDDSDRIATFKINAWEDDYFDNPIYSILNSIKDRYKNKNDLNSEQYKAAFRHIALSAATVLSGGWLNFHDLKNEVKEADDFINIFNEMESVTSIRSKIMKLLKELRGNKKVFFFIDELDRANPSYVLDLLESIKHFFAIPEVHFIILTDRKQLNNIIINKYGETATDGGFYKKLIDIEFNLNEIDINRYYDFLIDSNNFREYQVFKKTENYIRSIIIKKQLSLRLIDKLLLNLSLVLPLLEKDDFMNNLRILGGYEEGVSDLILSILLVVKVNNSLLLKRLSNGSQVRSDEENIVSYIPENNYKFPFGSNQKHSLAGLIYAITLNEQLLDKDQLSRFNTVEINDEISTFKINYLINAKKFIYMDYIQFLGQFE